MKYLLLIILLSFCTKQMLSQEVSDMKKQLIADRDTITKYYNCEKTSKKNAKAVLPQTLDSSFQTIFNTVILNNNDIVNTGSAGSITQDEKSGKLSVNYALQTTWKQFLNIGVSVESNEGVWNLYTQNSWQNTLALNLGYTMVGKKNGQYFYPTECFKLEVKRKAFLDSLMLVYYSNLSVSVDSIESIIKSNQAFITIDSSKMFNADISNDTFNVVKERYAKLKQESDSLSVLLKNYNKIKNAYNKKNLKSLFVDEIVKFELRNNIFTGYNIQWWNLGFSFGNTQNKLYNDTLQRDSLIKFNVSDYTRYRFSANYNYVHNGKYFLSFFTGGVSLYNTNFLEKKELKDIPFIKPDSTGKKYVFSSDEKNIHLGSLDELKKNIWIVNPSLYYANFFIFKRMLGFEVFGDYKAKLNKLKTADFPDTYSLYAGVIFRVDSKEVLPKATIALDFGLYDAPVERRGADFFSLRLKLGVPFNTIVKKKE